MNCDNSLTKVITMLLHSPHVCGRSPSHVSRDVIHKFLRPAFPQGGGRICSLAGSFARMVKMNSDSALLVFVNPRNQGHLFTNCLIKLKLFPVIIRFEVILSTIYSHQIHTVSFLSQTRHVIVFHTTQSVIAAFSRGDLSVLCSKHATP